MWVLFERGKDLLVLDSVRLIAMIGSWLILAVRFCHRLDWDWSWHVEILASWLGLILRPNFFENDDLLSFTTMGWSCLLCSLDLTRNGSKCTCFTNSHSSFSIPLWFMPVSAVTFIDSFDCSYSTLSFGHDVSNLAEWNFIAFVPSNSSLSSSSLSLPLFSSYSFEGGGTGSGVYLFFIYTILFLINSLRDFQFLHFLFVGAWKAFALMLKNELKALLLSGGFLSGQTPLDPGLRNQYSFLNLLR